MSLNPQAPPFEPDLLPPFLELYADLQAIKTYHTLLLHAAHTSEDHAARALARRAVRALHNATAHAAGEAGRFARALSGGRR